MHEWMADNGLTPHIVIDVTADGLQVPEGLAEDGKLILNVSYAATRALSLGNDAIVFEARFNGVPHPVTVPVDAILGIYARETGQGMAFVAEDAPPPPGSGPGPKKPVQADQTSESRSADAAPARPERPVLKVVK